MIWYRGIKRKVVYQVYHTRYGIMYEIERGRKEVQEIRRGGHKHDRDAVDCCLFSLEIMMHVSRLMT